MIICVACLGSPDAEFDGVLSCGCGRFSIRPSNDPLYRMWCFRYGRRGLRSMVRCGSLLHDTDMEWSWRAVEEEDQEDFVRKILDNFLAREVLES